jgi:hypothetical protein
MRPLEVLIGAVLHESSSKANELSVWTDERRLKAYEPQHGQATP